MVDAPKRFLWPREHGAWGQMAMPLATGLALGRPGLAAWLLALAAALAFLAHEPVLVLLGARGTRALSEDGSLARRLLAALGVPAAAAGLAGLALAPAALPWLALPGLLLLATMGFARRRAEMTTAGEIVAGAAMASALLPVAVAAGAGAGATAHAFLAWVISFAMAAIAVEAVLARGRAGSHRTRGGADPGRRNAARAAGVWAASAVAAALGLLPGAVPLALAPTAAFGVGICLGGVGPGRLARLGWMLVASTLFTLAVLVAGLRGA